MKIEFENAGLYYKYNTLKTLCNIYNIEIDSIKKITHEDCEYDLIQIDFKTNKAYISALHKYCIIPIDHKIL